MRLPSLLLLIALLSHSALGWSDQARAFANAASATINQAAGEFKQAASATINQVAGEFKQVKFGESFSGITNEAVGQFKQAASATINQASGVFKQVQDEEVLSKAINSLTQFFSDARSQTSDQSSQFHQWWAGQRRDEKTRPKANFFAGIMNDAVGLCSQAASATINQAVGVFKQVNKAKEPIFHHVSGGDWGMRQINTIGRTALYKPSYFGSAVNGLGKFVWFGAVAMEAANVAQAAGKDLEEGKITNTVHASSKAIGSWTGAAYGASAGAAMLSFVPGVGTLVGGIAGGIIGAYTGTKAGEMAATVVVGQA